MEQFLSPKLTGNNVKLTLTHYQIRRKKMTKKKLLLKMMTNQMTRSGTNSKNHPASKRVKNIVTHGKKESNRQSLQNQISSQQ